MDAASHLLPYLFMLMRGLVVLCLIHAVVTRQDYYWLAVLIFAAIFGGFFSTVGTLVYAFTIFSPWLRGRGKVAGQVALRGVEALKPLDTRIREAQALLAESDTLQNRSDLAALQARGGQLDAAQATLQSLLTGIYADDPVVLLSSAELDLARQQPAGAEAKLERVDLKTSAGTRTRALTLLAQAQEAQQKPAADASYQAAMQGATSEEPRVRYAAYLLRQGRPDEARTLLEAVAKTQSKATALYRKQEREWFGMAAELRKQLP